MGLLNMERKPKIKPAKARTAAASGALVAIILRTKKVFTSYKHVEDTFKLSGNFVTIEEAIWKYGQTYILVIVKRNSNC